MTLALTKRNIIYKKDDKIAIRATYYIFCGRNKIWASPDLMKFFLIIQFQAANYKLPIRRAIYNFIQKGK